MLDSAPSPAAASDDASATTPAETAPPPAPLTLAGEQPFVINDYDPADYRWVPVRRRPRIDGWTEEKQRRFIETLADTGLVSAAAKEVGMTPRSAYQLRRAPYAAAFARAWDAARAHAGSVLEDVAFERAIEGVEQNVFNEHGEVVCTKRVPDNRLLMLLLKHLKPERYAADALGEREPPPPAMDLVLRAMEPVMPAPPEQLCKLDELEVDLEVADADICALPSWHNEQRPKLTEAQAKARKRAASDALGAAVSERYANKKAGETVDVTDEEFLAMCRYIDPTQWNDKPKRLYK